MLTPLVAVLIVMLVLTRDGYSRSGWAKLGLHRLGVRAWLPAVLVPVAVMAVAYLIIWSTGLASFGVPAEIDGNPTGPLFWLLFPVGLLMTTLLSTVSNGIGEELGWRGFLLPHLAGLGTIPALLVTGFLHAIWHLPVILLSGLYHVDGNRLIVLPLFVITVTLAGTFMGYMRLISGSVWTASLAHSAHNVAWNAFGYFTLAGSDLAVEYLAGDTGLLLALGYGVIAALIVVRLRKRSADTQSSDRPLSPLTPVG